MDANFKRDILRRTILELLSNGDMHYTELEKKACTAHFPFSTSNRFKSQLRYLIENNHINRIARGIYQITPKGIKYEDILKI